MTMSEEMQALLKSASATNEQIVGLLARQNDVPTTVPTPVDPEIRKAVMAGAGDDTGSDALTQIRKRILLDEDRERIAESLKDKSLKELHVAFAKQAVKQEAGIPLHTWLSSGGPGLAQRLFDERTGLAKQLDAGTALQLQKALDSTAGGALIRQDLEPILYQIFIRNFPLYDRFDRVPSNGLVHAYNRQTSYGDADWIGELDTVTDDRGEYERAFTNVGILATRRGVSLKAQFAVLQGGSGVNPERLELQGGMLAMSRRLQKTILYGNWTDNTGTINNELGPFDDDSFDGLRKTLADLPVSEGGTGISVNVDPATNPDTTGSIRRAVDLATENITETGGTPSIVIFSTQDRRTFNEQQEEKLRIIETDDGARSLTVGTRVTMIATNSGDLPVFSVPGGDIGPYDPAANYPAANTVRDIYVLDENTITMPYLGSPNPTVLEIPIGVSGQLTHLFIVFMMIGMAHHVPTWNTKVRVKVS